MANRKEEGTRATAIPQTHADSANKVTTYRTGELLTQQMLSGTATRPAQASEGILLLV